jgi:hypothetical protein
MLIGIIGQEMTLDHAPEALVRAHATAEVLAESTFAELNVRWTVPGREIESVVSVYVWFGGAAGSLSVPVSGVPDTFQVTTTSRGLLFRTLKLVPHTELIFTPARFSGGIVAGGVEGGATAGVLSRQPTEPRTIQLMRPNATPADKCMCIDVSRTEPGRKS